MTRVSALPLLLLMTVACSTPTAAVSGPELLHVGERVNGAALAVERESYRKGEAATVHLINGSPDEIGYNTCTSAREFLVDEEWIRIEPLRMCTAAIYPLAAGERTSFTEPITSEWEAGSYRIVLRVYPAGASEQTLLTTAAFQVLP